MDHLEVTVDLTYCNCDACGEGECVGCVVSYVVGYVVGYVVAYVDS